VLRLPSRACSSLLAFMWPQSEAHVGYADDTTLVGRLSTINEKRRLATKGYSAWGHAIHPDKWQRLWSGPTVPPPAATPDGLHMSAKVLGCYLEAGGGVLAGGAASYCTSRDGVSEPDQTRRRCTNERQHEMWAAPGVGARFHFVWYGGARADCGGGAANADIRKQVLTPAYFWPVSRATGNGGYSYTNGRAKSLRQSISAITN
jgi:hypothetical protein